MIIRTLLKTKILDMALNAFFNGIYTNFVKQGLLRVTVDVDSIKVGDKFELIKFIAKESHTFMEFRHCKIVYIDNKKIDFSTETYGNIHFEFACNLTIRKHAFELWEFYN